ncbi:MAG: hypothetical protein WDW36_003622 [Sanguina aurantia]
MSWAVNADRIGDFTALEDPHRKPAEALTFREAYESMCCFAAGLQSLGLQKGERVCLFSENSPRWLVADQGIMMNGAADAVRGATAPADELSYITTQSGAVGLVLQDEDTLVKLLAKMRQQQDESPPHPPSESSTHQQPTHQPSHTQADSSQHHTDTASQHDGVQQASSQQAPPNSPSHAQQHTNGAPAASSLPFPASPPVEPASQPILALQHLKFVVLLYPSARPSSPAVQQQLRSSLPCDVLHYGDVLVKGTAASSAMPEGFRPVPCALSDLATLVYTSGTTGLPKAVMLTHGNLMSQIDNLSFFLPGMTPGENVLSILPPWHIYERTVSYFVLGQGCRQVYTNIRRFRDDLASYPPDYFVCVPLLLDTLYNRVMGKLKDGSAFRVALIATLLSASVKYIQVKRVLDGVSLQYARTARPPLALATAALVATLLTPVHALATQLVFGRVRSALGVKQVAISGGGSLASHLDDFYEAIGLPVLNGWGLSETSPVLACRRALPLQNIRGTVGLPTPGMHLRVVDPESLQDVPDGTAGLILAKGPGVTAGYWANERTTAQAFRAGDGWYDTGDLGWRAPHNIPGSRMGGSHRADWASLIKHAAVVGQDKRELGVLLFPDEESEGWRAAVAAAWERSGGLAAASAGGSVDGASATSVRLQQQLKSESWPAGMRAELEQLLLAEVERLNTTRLGYQEYERVAHVAIVTRPLSIDDNTLTRTMKMRRKQVMDLCAEQASALAAKLR